MFTAALLKIAKTWEQPECLSGDEWIKKMWYMYTHNEIIFSNKKRWNSVICDYIDENWKHSAKWGK